MPGSYENINYALRPAKHIERKMLCESFRLLSEFAAVDSYRYVGFGSIYFSDFELIHRSLNIRDMISIERDAEKKNRFEFNKPFGCISMEYEESNVVLPNLEWDRKTILWLDYDGKLDSSVLADITTFCVNASSGSVIVISVNADNRANRTGAIDDLIKSVGQDKVPADIEDRDLSGWNTGQTYRRIINNEIKDALASRNGVKDKDSRLTYRQLFNFEYADGAKMLTIGGILYEEGQKGHFDKCNFKRLAHTKMATKPYRIDVPLLTYRELLYLSQRLPKPGISRLKKLGIPSKDLASYGKVYRHFPMFAETMI